MMSRLVPPGKLYESLLLELERAMTAATDAAGTPIAVTVMADNNIGPTVGRAWMEEFLVWTILGYFASKMAQMYREKLLIKRQSERTIFVILKKKPGKIYVSKTPRQTRTLFSTMVHRQRSETDSPTADKSHHMSVSAFQSKTAEICLAKIELHFEKVDFQRGGCRNCGRRDEEGVRDWHDPPLALHTAASRSLHAKTL